MSKRDLFLKHIAQTRAAPSMIEVVKAEGVRVLDASGKTYYDLSSGIGPNILGNRHPAVVEALHIQLDQYLHTMVYGEHVQSPQVELARTLIEHLPKNMEKVYFLSSGSEAIEAALKIAKLYTGRTKIISASNAYHGSTIGAESLRSDIDFTMKMAPLVPDIDNITFNNINDLNKIDEHVAAVIMETVQAENGVRVPDATYMKALRARCDENGTLLILDEIQVGLGRTGRLFAFEHFGIAPDMLVLGKALGGGLPLSAVIASQDIMQTISERYPLAHLTTFGGNPMCCAAGKAVLDHIINEKMWVRAEEIGQRFESNLRSESWTMRRAGAMIAFDVGDENEAVNWQSKLVEAGIIVDLLLFNTSSWRIAPPITISDDEIDEVSELILSLR